ncbi:MAG: hypothetical protein NC388_00810 [Clostridium sp.]|nr:hypothetical protein [Clostridium sp.]
MKKYLKFPLYLMMGACVSATMVACDEDEPAVEQGGGSQADANEILLGRALEPYVNHTVVPTYRNMADNCMLLSEQCELMLEHFNEGALTTGDVRKAGEYWNEARKYWEQSEAFLYGAAEDYSIDPHIDSWPLDQTLLEGVLSNRQIMEEVSKDYSYIADVLGGYGVLGFHTVEYFLFELSADGNTAQTHSLSYTKEQLNYLCAVAGDLRNQAVRLEAAWAGMENITEAKQVLLEENELEPTKNYGDYMLNAGNPGSIYRSAVDAAQQIIQGCMDIADEVAMTKMGRPAHGTSAEDWSYIESPYSLNSLVDFQDNIRSIRNSYQGSVEGDASISDFIQAVDADLDVRMRTAVAEAIEAIGRVDEPFAKTATTSPFTDPAIEAVSVLNEALEDVYAALTKYN